jgi:uncharacterized phage protein gp47/JayE
MPNQIDSYGLTIKDNAELVTAITDAIKGVYGSDISVESDSPDGQLIGIIAQVMTDMLELLVTAFNTFDPDEASGTILDKRVAINGITRTAGTYTLTKVSITADRSLNLIGLSDTEQGIPFTVSDGSGNEFYLVDNESITTGTASLDFRAKDIGAVEVLQNTITNQVTITLGVTTVNNPLAATSVGLNEETDVALKIRRAKSYFLQAAGPADAVQAALLELDGVTDALVLENDTGTEADGIPANSIWAIVENGTDADIAQAIYVKKPAGCATFGGETVTVDRPNSQTIDINFDRPLNEDLYIEFTMTPKIAGQTFDEDYIKAQLVLALEFSIGAGIDNNEIIKQLFIIEPDAIYTAVGVSLTSTGYTETLDNTDKQSKFTLAVGDIDITS